jgi:hypothetical protein
MAVMAGEHVEHRPSNDLPVPFNAHAGKWWDDHRINGCAYKPGSTNIRHDHVTSSAT